MNPHPLLHLIRSQRRSLPITINSSYANPSDVPPVQGFCNVYYEMHRQNRGRKAEGPGIYALRTSKPWFLTEAVKNYQGRFAPGSKLLGYTFWVDTGSFQDGLRGYDWPDLERVKGVFEGAEAAGRNEDELMFFPMNDVPNPMTKWWRDNMGPLYRDFTQGTSPLYPFTSSTKLTKGHSSPSALL